MSRKLAIVTGASSGLGKFIKAALERQLFDAERRWEVVDWSLATGVDVTDQDSIIAAARAASAGGRRVDALVNCAGINRIDYLPNFTHFDFNEVMDTNAKAIFLTTRALLPNLAGKTIEEGGTILNIASNAAHVPMTGSLAYNASKAAAWMMTRQLSRELIKTHKITVFSISPNKLKGTGMSEYIDQRVCEVRGWSPEEAAKYQAAALPTGQETDPHDLAEFIAFLLSDKRRHMWFAGCDIPYGL